MQVYSYYKSTTGYAGTETPLAVNCVAFFFKGYDAVISDGSLEFTFENQAFSDGKVEVVTVSDGGQKMDVNVTILQGGTARVRFDRITSLENLSFYPNHCSMYAKPLEVIQ